MTPLSCGKCLKWRLDGLGHENIRLNTNHCEMTEILCRFLSSKMKVLEYFSQRWLWTLYDGYAIFCMTLLIVLSTYKSFLSTVEPVLSLLSGGDGGRRVGIIHLAFLNNGSRFPLPCSSKLQCSEVFFVCRKELTVGGGRWELLRALLRIDTRA